MAGYVRKSIQPIWNNFYGIVIVLFIVHHLLEHFEWSHWLFRAYLDDILVLPIILPPTLVLLRFFFKNEKLVLGIPLIVTAWIMLSVVFEVLLPFYSEVYTGDYLDLLFYLAGGNAYWIYEIKVLKD